MWNCTPFILGGLGELGGKDDLHRSEVRLTCDKVGLIRHKASVTCGKANGRKGG